MKLFHKNVKKKPLTDKAKDLRKQKVKHVIKVILDVLIYGFAILMALALVVGGSCSPKAASAYYHSDNGYTSINSVVVTDRTTTLRYYYDYNYKKTFPKWDTLFDIFGSMLTTAYPSVHIEGEGYTIDDTTYHYLSLIRDSYTDSTTGTTYVRFTYYLSVSGYQASDKIAIVTLTQNDTTINRSDILTALFSGAYTFKVNSSNTNNNNWFKYLTYYFGELGYNRITYTFPINVSRLAYLFVNTDNTDSLIENGYFFKNDNFFTIDDNEGISTFDTLLLGSFRCNGVYYSSIRVRFSSVFGNMLYGDSSYRVKYHMTNNGNADDYLPSWNEFYRGYWYIDKIYYENSNISQEVWSAFKTIVTPYSGYDYFDLQFVDNWVGDTPYSSSPYRDLYIYYVNSALTGVIAYPFNENYPQLYGMSFADFINYIGEAYPSGNNGVPQDNTSPFTSVFEWLRSALSGAMPLFGYTLIPGITIGTLIMVPITMSIILFVVKLFKR